MFKMTVSRALFSIEGYARVVSDPLGLTVHVTATLRGKTVQFALHSGAAELLESLSSGRKVVVEEDGLKYSFVPVYAY